MVRRDPLGAALVANSGAGFGILDVVRATPRDNGNDPNSNFFTLAL
ncbi:hypothetical protein [Rhodococcus sp. NCIMB 12038]|nr:hypothetical protein [Rhodococcus sp. NCIMB 12038]